MYMYNYKKKNNYVELNKLYSCINRDNKRNNYI